MTSHNFSQWRSQQGLRAINSDIHLSLDNHEGKNSTLLILNSLVAVPTKLFTTSSYSDDSRNDDVIGSSRNSKYLQKIDVLNRKLTRGQHTSRVEEGEQQSQRKNKARDTDQKKGTETVGYHEDHIKSALLSQNIPHEVGVSEGKDEREQQDIPKVDPALHNHFLEFLSSAKATTAAASSLPSSSNEEIAEGKSIRTNLSECKKVIKYLLRCLQGIKLSVENDGDIKSKVKTKNQPSKIV